MFNQFAKNHSILFWLKKMDKTKHDPKIYTIHSYLKISIGIIIIWVLSNLMFNEIFLASKHTKQKQMKLIAEDTNVRGKSSNKSDSRSASLKRE